MSTGDTESEKFSWSDKDYVVIEPVDAVAIYQNPAGNIVIRQMGPMGEDDSIIVVPRSRLKDLITALQNELGE